MTDLTIFNYEEQEMEWIPKKADGYYGYVYILELTKTRSKIGQTTNPCNRIKSHALNLKNVGNKNIKRIALSDKHTNYREIETHIKRKYCNASNRSEYVNIPFDTIVDEFPYYLMKDESDKLKLKSLKSTLDLNIAMRGNNYRHSQDFIDDVNEYVEFSKEYHEKLESKVEFANEFMNPGDLTSLEDFCDMTNINIKDLRELLGSSGILEYDGLPSDSVIKQKIFRHYIDLRVEDNRYVSDTKWELTPKGVKWIDLYWKQRHNKLKNQEDWKRWNEARGQLVLKIANQ